MVIIDINNLSIKRIGTKSCAWLLNPDDIAGMNIGITKLYPGEEIPLNTHKKPEVFFIQSGIANLYVSEKNYKVKKRDIIIIPNETKHSIRNIGSEILEMIFIMPPEDE